MKNYIFILLLSLFLTAGCGQDKSKSKDLNSTGVNHQSEEKFKKVIEPVKDTNILIITSSSVVFYSLTQDEYNIKEASGAKGIEEFVDDFNEYSAIAYRYCKSNGINVSFSSCGRFTVSNNMGLITNHSRYIDGTGYGMIVYDGKNGVEIVKGMSEDYVKRITQIIRKK